ncbi:MAG: hypothetical protein ACE5F9_14935, partial [Phycisphaerae bacterium]
HVFRHVFRHVVGWLTGWCKGWEVRPKVCRERIPDTAREVVLACGRSEKACVRNNRTCRRRR